MKALREFDLEIYKISNKKHQYSFELDNSFFSSFEDSLIHEGKLHVDLEIEKSDVLIIAQFSIKGTVTLICDRSLENFDFPIDTNNRIIFKYGEDFAELTDEIISIPHGIQKLNVAQYIYEFIGLTVPMKKLHPRFQNKEEKINLDSDEEETVLIYSTENSDSEEIEGQDNKENKDTNIDPRWNILNGLKHNNN
jgi:uncharacterized protein